MSRIETVIIPDVFIHCIERLDIDLVLKKLVLYLFNLLPKDDPDYEEVVRGYQCLLSDLPWNCNEEELKKDIARKRREENIQLFRLQNRDYLPGIIAFLMYYLNIHKVVGKDMKTIADCIYEASYGIPFMKLSATFREAKTLYYVKIHRERMR